MFKSSLLTLLPAFFFALLIPLSYFVDSSPKVIFYFQEAAQDSGRIVVGEPIQITGYLNLNNVRLKDAIVTFFYIDSGEERNCLMDRTENGDYKFIVTFMEPGIHNVTIFAQYGDTTHSFSWDINVKPK